MGKRKRDEDETENAIPNDSSNHGSTIFVSNLPYTATSTDLKTLFSDVAPVKNAFVVLEKETKVSKGVGYVIFAMREDATQCVEKGTVDMNGRTLRVDWAGAKPKPGEETPKKPQSPVKRPNNNAPNRNLSNDPDAIRTIAITGLPEDIDSKVLWKKVRKQPGAETIKYPAILFNGSEDKTQAFVVFTSASQAIHAAEKLNAHIYKGVVIGATLKKRLDKRPNRSSRLIIRNLPWDVTEADLRALFLPHGPIYSVEIPTEPNREGEKARTKLKAKGFAFVWMLTKGDAENALESVNGSTLKERVIAVDWALSKSKWQDVQDQMEASEPTKDLSDNSDDGSSSSGQDEDDGLGVHSAEDVSMHSAASGEEEEGDEEREEPIKPQLPPPEAGTTLFIRNVPWEATEDELRQLLRTFGPLRYVRIVMDKELDRSKGTAFACYWKKEDADKVIAQSEALSKESGMEKSARNPFSMPSLLAPDPSSSLARSLVLHGRTFDVVRAVTRETAGKLHDAGVKMREKADKRNLYLMREGVIFPNSPAASTMLPAALEKRVISFNQRRALLRSNPSLYVSKTRLSIRQLPTFVTERGLKRLALYSIREFDKEVKAGEREGLDEDELEHDAIEPLVDSLTGEEVSLPHRDKDSVDATGAKSQKQKQKVSRSSKAKDSPFSSKVKQSKIVRLAERIDPLNGKGRSKGYGFLELERHSDALKILRWANNNPDVGPLLTGWWHEELKESLGLLEKKNDLDEETSARRKRMKDTLAGLNGGDDTQKQKQSQSKRTLIIEFSIENVVVVRKREGRPTNATVEGDNPTRGKEKIKIKIEKEEDREVQLPPSKKRKRVDGDVSKSPGKDLKARIGERADAQPINIVGSMMGRKRRMKKSTRKG